MEKILITLLVNILISPAGMTKQSRVYEWVMSRCVYETESRVWMSHVMLCVWMSHVLYWWVCLQIKTFTNRIMSIFTNRMMSIFTNGLMSISTNRMISILTHQIMSILKHKMMSIFTHRIVSIFTNRMMNTFTNRMIQPIADRVAQHLESISKTFPTNHNSTHGIYD